MDKSYQNESFKMSLFDEQLGDFREPPPPFNGQNSLTGHKKTSDVP